MILIVGANWLLPTDQETGQIKKEKQNKKR